MQISISSRDNGMAIQWLNNHSWMAKISRQKDEALLCCGTGHLTGVGRGQEKKQ